MDFTAVELPIRAGIARCLRAAADAYECGNDSRGYDLVQKSFEGVGALTQLKERVGATVDFLRVAVAVGPEDVREQRRAELIESEEAQAAAWVSYDKAVGLWEKQRAWRKERDLLELPAPEPPPFPRPERG